MFAATVLTLVLGVTFEGLGRVDLASINRTVTVPPSYQTKTQEYCLLVFGPTADTRIWLVRDGATLHVDLNGNGRLDEPGERFVADASCWTIGKVVEGNGRRHSGLLCQQTDGRYDVIVRIDGSVQQRTYGMRWSTKPNEAPIVHFRGPARLRLDSLCEVTREPDQRNGVGLGQGKVVTRGDKGYLEAELGTPGLGGPDTFAHLLAHQLASNPEAGVLALFEFTGADGRPVPVKTRLEITEGISGPVYIPPNARAGWVRVRVALIGWQPQTAEFEVQVR